MRFERTRSQLTMGFGTASCSSKQSRVRRLFFEALEHRAMLTSVTGVIPALNSHNAPAATAISATFDANINAATATPDTLVIHSRHRGQIAPPGVTVTTSGSMLTASPAATFQPGELLQVTATAAIQSTFADPVSPFVWEFRTRVNGGLGTFAEAQLLGNHSSRAVALGDLDNDGDLDAFVATQSPEGNRVWLNSDGVFRDSGQSLGQMQTWDVALGDIDGDGDVDAFAANWGDHRIWLNEGGVFTAGQSLPEPGSLRTGAVALGDLDGDGDLDAFIGNLLNVPSNSDGVNRVWLNEGGIFVDSGQRLVGSGGGGADVELGDLDGDGDLDAFVTNSAIPGTRVWFNDGGVFSDSGQNVGSNFATAAALGDLDGDGDLDVVIGSSAYYRNRVWMNNGLGVFSDSEQDLGADSTGGIEVGDLDGDGDLDVFISNSNAGGTFGYANKVWTNNGNGTFSDSGQALGGQRSSDVALGDLDGDDDLDIFVANAFGEADRIWLNENPPASVSLTVDKGSLGEVSGVATLAATIASTTEQDVTVELEITGTATVNEDFLMSASQIVIPAGAMTGEITFTAVNDLQDEADETVIIDIASVTNGTEAGTQQVTIVILDDDDPPTPEVTLSVDNSEIAEAGGLAEFFVTLSESTTVPVTVDLAISGTAAGEDFTTSTTQVVLAAGSTSGSLTVMAADDEVHEPDETVIVDIATVVNGSELGEQRQTTTILDDDTPTSFRVTSLTPTDSGFRVAFNGTLDGRQLNLNDTLNANRGAADVTLTGASRGEVAGSLIIGDTGVEFVKSGDALGADTYTVTLLSAVDGFKDDGGSLLDGDSDGLAGGDYTVDFTVEAPPVGARTVSIPDFVRGPGQEVNLPADMTLGIPVTVSEGDNVRAADLRISYDPELLEITGATAAPGGTVVLNNTTPGEAILVYFSPTPLAPGKQTFINLQANVPTENANYQSLHVLDVHSVVVGDGNDNEFPVVTDDAAHFVTYFADVSGNGRINASDAAQVARFAALIEAGFAASLNVDPILIGDVSGNGRINAADASRVAQFSALIDVPEIPAIPTRVAIAILGLSQPGPGPPGTWPLPARLGPDGTLGTVASETPLWDLPQGAEWASASKSRHDLVMAALDKEKGLDRRLEEAITELLSDHLSARVSLNAGRS